MYILPVLLPYTYAFYFKFDPSGFTSSRGLDRDRRRIDIWRRNLCELRAYASASFVSLFVLGPLLTISFGLIRALLVIVPLHVFLFLASFVLLILNHREFAISKLDVLKYAGATLLMPGCLPNICRKISLDLFKTHVDGGAFVRQFGPTAVAEDFADVVSFRAGEMPGDVIERETAANTASGRRPEVDL